VGPESLNAATPTSPSSPSEDAESPNGVPSEVVVPPGAAAEPPAAVAPPAAAAACVSPGVAVAGTVPAAPASIPKFYSVLVTYLRYTAWFTTFRRLLLSCSRDSDQVDRY
jgi:hypothetical protein